MRLLLCQPKCEQAQDQPFKTRCPLVRTREGYKCTFHVLTCSGHQTDRV